MKRLMICSPLLAVLLLCGAASDDGAGASALTGINRPAEFEACVEAFYSRDAGERLRAVQDLSGWALDGELREEALELLALARHDSEQRVVLQAEVALASLTGGDREAVRAAYGIVPPDARDLAIAALQAKKPKERLRALVALGRWHRGSEIATLLAATRDPAAAVRLHSLELLSEIVGESGSSESVIEALARAAMDPDPAVRELAVAMMVRSLR